MLEHSLCQGAPRSDMVIEERLRLLDAVIVLADILGTAVSLMISYFPVKLSTEE